MRMILLALALAGFTGLALLDLTRGHYSVGSAALLLVVANFLLLR